MSTKARFTGKDNVDLDTSVEKGENYSKESSTVTAFLCRRTVVKLIQDESKNYNVILA